MGVIPSPPHLQDSQPRDSGDIWGPGHYQPSSFAKLTVYIPLDAPGRKLQCFVDLFQHSLQLLFLGDLRLGNLCHIELLTLQLLWGDKKKELLS